jgi:3-phosphoshikimate 1-carboxyvinyltransferase
MGCEITWKDNNVTIQGKELKSITVNMMDTPDLVPPLAIAAAFAKGKSTFTGVGHLRYKECNRLEAIVDNLGKMGINAYYDEDNLYVEGDNKKITGARINTYNDHRIAMSFAIAGLAVENQIITDKKCVAKSFPDFWERMEVFY